MSEVKVLEKGRKDNTKLTMKKGIAMVQWKGQLTAVLQSKERRMARTTGKDTDEKKKCSLGSAVCSDKMWGTSQDARETRGRENEKRSKRLRNRQPHRLSTDYACTHFTSDHFKAGKESENSLVVTVYRFCHPFFGPFLVFSHVF